MTFTEEIRFLLQVWAQTLWAGATILSVSWSTWKHRPREI